MTLLSSFKKDHPSQKPAILFIIKLIILACLGKTIFYWLNVSALGNAVTGLSSLGRVIYWGLLYDLLIIAAINLPFFLLAALPAFRKGVLRIFLTLFFALLNTLNIALAVVDIFYFKFHLQRADADLLYVLQNPFRHISRRYAIAAILILLATALICWAIHRSLNRILIRSKGRNGWVTTVLAAFLVLFLATGTKKLLPTYPLTRLTPGQLDIVENSLHSFSYSVFRRNETQLSKNIYMDEQLRKSLFDYHVINNQHDSVKKNIVLFIMESVPEDFFNPSSPYKVKMPFLDSIVAQSTYFSNAFSYSHNSNKGITAILAGIPTLLEIPLYHSRYVSIPVTAVGSTLHGLGYHSSFFIGDHYDDFGFAKCCNWLGIDRYYSMESIPGYEKMSKQTMGLHDQYVLNFMSEKIHGMTEPFFVTQYNISTHFPYDKIPGFNEPYPLVNRTAPQRCMSYYNQCLQSFFARSKQEAWFKNTVFIFCADHWMYPDQNKLDVDMVQGFRIPIFVYDPSKPIGTKIETQVSQLDIVNTVLYYAGYTKPFLSYGQNLVGSLPVNRTVFSKENNVLYQAFDSSYVLGFDALNGKPVFAYNYKQDPARSNNLLGKQQQGIDSLEWKMKAFLQAGQQHYMNFGHP